VAGHPLPVFSTGPLRRQNIRLSIIAEAHRARCARVDTRGDMFETSNSVMSLPAASQTCRELPCCAGPQLKHALCEGAMRPSSSIHGQSDPSAQLPQASHDRTGENSCGQTFSACTAGGGGASRGGRCACMRAQAAPRQHRCWRSLRPPDNRCCCFRRDLSAAPRLSGRSCRDGCSPQRHGRC
jgi:hypothetical protein